MLRGMTKNLIESCEEAQHLSLSSYRQRLKCSSGHAFRRYRSRRRLAGNLGRASQVALTVPIVPRRFLHTDGVICVHSIGFSMSPFEFHRRQHNDGFCDAIVMLCVKLLFGCPMTCTN